VHTGSNLFTPLQIRRSRSTSSIIQNLSEETKEVGNLQQVKLRSATKRVQEKDIQIPDQELHNWKLQDEPDTLTKNPFEPDNGAGPYYLGEK